MALVMLPCDLPWWDKVKKYLEKIAKTKNTHDLIEDMTHIYDLCNISLDPDDENPDPDQFLGLKNFLELDLTNEEQYRFFNKTLQNIVSRALKLKEVKPKNGLHFSLQQQPDCTDLEYDFIASLIANAFFSTFPKRTTKSHPTLRNFNFSDFFKSLHLNSQKAKLRSLLYYFDWIENNQNCNGSLRILRQVMSGKEWLTIEDWLECNLPLCPVQIKHDSRLERAEANSLQICFASSKIGEKVLAEGCNQEAVNIITFPELLATLLNVESLEDNEVITIENVRHVTRISDPKHKATLEKLEYPYATSVCCMDADDYTKLPIGQYEEDNILRELNKCLLAFQQKQHQISESHINSQTPNPYRHRRLSPIGESSSSGKYESKIIPMITQQSCSTTKSESIENNSFNNNNLKVHYDVEKNASIKVANTENLVHNRRGRFIVLGSSGECLPVTRRPLEPMKTLYSSFESSDEEFHSAKTSLEDTDDENVKLKYSIDLNTSERRQSFANKLKDALKNDSAQSTSSSDSSFALGISVTGSKVKDNNITVRRGGSIGFALQEESLDEQVFNNSLRQEKEWIDKFKNKQSGNIKDSTKSSDYSFSTEYSSELEELYEQFSKWLEDPIIKTDKGTKKELNTREIAVVKFAGSLLKRTLSESFAGVPVPLMEEIETISDVSNSRRNSGLILNAKSLSLELARHNHRLAAQLNSFPTNNEAIFPALTNAPSKKNENKKKKVWFISDAIVQNLEDITINLSIPKPNKISQIHLTNHGHLRPIATGNWGCGSSRKGDAQIKVIIQWLAASVAGAPSLIYYTNGHQQIAKLDTICRILVDRKWCVKDLAQALLRYSNQVLHGREISGNLFQELIGFERNAE